MAAIWCLAWMATSEVARTPSTDMMPRMLSEADAGDVKNGPRSPWCGMARSP